MQYNKSDYNVLSRTEINELFKAHGVPNPTLRVIHLFFIFDRDSTSEIGNGISYYKAKFTPDEGSEIIEKTKATEFALKSYQEPNKQKKDEIFNEFKTLFLKVQEQILAKRSQKKNLETV